MLNQLSDLGAALRIARTNSKRSQRSLAEAAKTTQATVDRIEHNQIDPRLSTLRRLLGELDYELVAIPRQSLMTVRDLIDQNDDDAPLIELDDAAR
jgi:transcriptional regulator with XRE-family HTH domain